MNTPLPNGPWQALFQKALKLIDNIHEYGIKDPHWTFGGGTVLMLRYQHRMSKDIDIFVPDPQYLGFVSPRLSDVAEAVSPDYVEGPGFIKILCPEGEIDFVASDHLTENPYENWTLFGRTVKVETSAEIVAKKLWHRGDRAAARDLFDLALVIENDAQGLLTAGPFLAKHRETFLDQLKTRRKVLETQFNAIDRLNYQPSYEHALGLATQFLMGLPK